MTTKIRVIVAALATLIVAAGVVAPAQASSGTLSNGVCYYASAGYGSYAGINGSMRISLSCRPRVYGDYVATKYNVRFPGWDGYHQSTQFERNDGNRSDFYANPGTTVYIQGCRERLFSGSICQSWAVLTVPWW